MAIFEVKVVEVSIEPHDNADALEIANIKGYQCIVRKGEYQTGDTAIYIPEQALVPKAILQEMNLWDDTKEKGKLVGKQGDRVKAVRLRGRLSQGLLYPNKENLPVGSEVSSELGIEKWEPPIPTQMSGQVAGVHGYTIKYDIENIKNHPEVVDFLIENGVKVQLTEKIHGCLHHSSLILLPNGGSEVPISEVISDDTITHVVSYDISSGIFKNKPITAKLKRPNIENKKWIKLTLENDRILILTEDHPVFSNDRNMFIPAKNVQEGEDIKSPFD